MMAIKADAMGGVQSRDNWIRSKGYHHAHLLSIALPCTLRPFSVPRTRTLPINRSPLQPGRPGASVERVRFHGDQLSARLGLASDGVVYSRPATTPKTPGASDEVIGRSRQERGGADAVRSARPVIRIVCRGDLASAPSSAIQTENDAFCRDTLMIKDDQFGSRS